MSLSAKDWHNFILLLRKLYDGASAEFTSAVVKNGWNTAEYLSGPQSEMIEFAYGLVTKYGEASASLSALMYDQIAEAEGQIIPPAVPAETADIGEVAKNIRGAEKFSKNVEYLSGVVGRMVKQAGADTTLQNALRDGAKFAWIPSGDTCAFCLTLASRGWQTASKRAIKGGHAEHIHSNCDCTYTISFEDDPKVEGYNPDYYKDLYYNAEGSSPNEKINSIRRMEYQENKDEINEQKRIAYAKRTSSDSEEK